ncbi:MAG: hypothetical protein HZB29_00250 [Nitrospinae bacterium]|nr:hypothetical protein [Nitrospinota bacterium]
MKKAILIENIPFNIDPLRVLREMKIPHIKSLDEITERPLAAAIKRGIDKAYSLIEGKGVFKTYALNGVHGEEVECEGFSGVFRGKHMIKLLAECDHATLLACTIGPKLESEVERLQNSGELTEAFTLEMIGGWMADYMAERVDERIAREIKKAGYVETMRFSPGYGDWGLENQPQVLKMAEAERIGVKLTETNIMIPRKSVSAVIGWKRAG